MLSEEARLSHEVAAVYSHGREPMETTPQEIHYSPEGTAAPFENLSVKEAKATHFIKCAFLRSISMTPNIYEVNTKMPSIFVHQWPRRIAASDIQAPKPINMQ